MLTHVEIQSSGPSAYAPLRPPGPIDLHLDANEATNPSVDCASLLAQMGPLAAVRYPSAALLEQAIAERLKVRPAQVLATAGGDEAIDRACRAFLRPGAELILPVPTFEMIERYAKLAQARVIPIPWNGASFPTQAVLNQINARTAMIAIVSPNNPTGAVAQAQDLQRISDAAPHAQLLVDLAYEEFAENPLSSVAVALPNTIVVRTFSKAFGLAGMRVGYAVASDSAANFMRKSGSPYSVSGLSLAAARSALSLPGSWLRDSADRVRDERARLQKLLSELGATASDSQGNFVLAQFKDANWVWRALAGVGIAVRRFSGDDLRDSLRITCPGHTSHFERLQSGLRSALAPQTILFALEQLRESDLPSLHSLSLRLPLTLIAKRSRGELSKDAMKRSAFKSVADIENYPSTQAAIEAILRQQGTPHGWMLCDSLAQIACARTAGLVPLAIETGSINASAFEKAGAARVLTSLAQLEGALP